MGRNQRAQIAMTADEISEFIQTRRTALRGVALEGNATIAGDPGALWDLGVNVWERYYGEYTEAMKPMVEMMLHNRIAVRLDVERVRFWDHRKLGLDAMPLGGSTAIHYRPAADH